MGLLSGILVFICIIAIIAVTVFVAYKVKEMNADYENKMSTLSKAINIGMSNAADYDTRQQTQINILNNAMKNMNSNFELQNDSNMILETRMNYFNSAMLASNNELNDLLYQISQSNSSFSNIIYKDFAIRSTTLSNFVYNDRTSQTSSNTQFATNINQLTTNGTSLSNSVYSGFMIQGASNASFVSGMNALLNSNIALSNATTTNFQRQAASNTAFTSRFDAMDVRFNLMTTSNTRFDNTFDILLNQRAAPSNIYSRALYTTDGVLLGRNSNGFLAVDTNGSTRIGYQDPSGSSSIYINKTATTVDGDLTVTKGINSSRNINVQTMGPLGTIIENSTNGTKVGVSGSNNTARLYTTGVNSLGLGYITDSGTGYNDALLVSRDGASFKTNVIGKLCFDDGSTCLDANTIKKLIGNGLSGPSSTQNIFSGRLIRRRININKNDITNKTAIDTLFNNLTADEIVHVSTFTIPTQDAFAFEYTGWISVPTAGLYTFGVTSDDSSDLSIYNNSSWLVVSSAYGNKTAIESTPPNANAIKLQANQPYPIRIRYYEYINNQGLRVYWKTPQNNTFTDVPFSVFSCDGTTPPTIDSIRTNFPDPRSS